jgi:hypothetical protein
MESKLSYFNNGVLNNFVEFYLELVAVMRRVLIIIILILIRFSAFSQFGACNCSASLPSGNTNFSAIVWTGTGCPSSPTDGGSYTGNLCLDLANGSNVSMNINFTINGDFNITNSGNSTVTIPVTKTLHVTGDLGDADNNNVSFIVNGSLTVDQTIWGKNGNQFSGSGSVTADGLDFKSVTCSPCSIIWDVNTCAPSPSAFCTTGPPPPN